MAQGATYLLPLVTVPYLVRVLGARGFGAVAFAQGLIAYLLVLVGYGFDQSASRRVSASRDDEHAVSRIGSSVLFAKLVLVVVAWAVASVLVLTVDDLRGVASVVVALAPWLLGNALYPGWLFQGLERLTLGVGLQLGVRLLGVASIFLVVRDADDVTVYAWILGLQWLAIGLVGLAVAIRSLGLNVRVIQPRDISAQLREGWTLFLSNVSITAYTRGNPLLLGLLTGSPALVGYYSAADRIVRAAAGLLNPISQSLYPRLAHLASTVDVAAIRAWRRRGLGSLLFVGLLTSVALSLAAPAISALLLGPEFSAATPLIRIMAWIPLVVSLSTFYGFLHLLPSHRDRGWLLGLVCGAVVGVVSALLLVPRLQAVGMAWSAVAAELAVTLAYVAYVAVRPAR